MVWRRVWGIVAPNPFTLTHPKIPHIARHVGIVELVVAQNTGLLSSLQAKKDGMFCGDLPSALKLLEIDSPHVLIYTLNFSGH